MLYRFTNKICPCLNLRLSLSRQSKPPLARSELVQEEAKDLAPSWQNEPNWEPPLTAAGCGVVRGLGLVETTSGGQVSGLCWIQLGLETAEAAGTAAAMLSFEPARASAEVDRRS